MMKKVSDICLDKIKEFEAQRCLVVGDGMATDIRMGNNFGAKTLFLTEGVHQLDVNVEQRLESLTESYGLNVDYYMERFIW